MLEMNKLIIIVIFLGVVIFPYSDFQPGSQSRNMKTLDIMFYNVENLFDTLDSELDDDEFLPQSQRRWNSFKYYRKLNNVFKVIALCSSDMSTPDFIGLCEIENHNVLDDLCKRTHLYQDKYGYVISEGKDERGINTALLFKEDILRLISSTSWCPIDEDGTHMETRAILHSSFAYGVDTLDIIVCHWPSRRGGAIESANRRRKVAYFLKSKIDSLGKDSKIIIMGDLNDEPDSDSVYKVLQAKEAGMEGSNNILVNTGSGYMNAVRSYKFQGTWYMFDQMILSTSLYQSERGLYYEKQSFRIVDEDVLLTEDNSYKGFRPYATWWGYEYTGGFSDHLPVTIRLGYR